MKENILKDKIFLFSVRVVNLVKYLQAEKREFVMSKQLLRSGTSIGANVREAIHAESKADFIHKLAVAQKEANESAYWIELLNATDYLSGIEFESIHKDVTELLKMLAKIIKTTKANA